MFFPEVLKNIIGRNNDYGLSVCNFDGSPLTTTSLLNIKQYSEIIVNEKFTYICEAQPGTALTSASWRIRKMIEDSTTGELDSVQWAGGITDFNFAATDLATVKAFTYS